MIFLLAIYLNQLVSYSSSKSRKSFIYGVLNLACAQKIGTGHFKNGSSVNFSNNQLCLQTAQSPFVQAWFCPMSKLLQEPTLTFVLQSEEVFEPALNRHSACQTVVTARC